MDKKIFLESSYFNEKSIKVLTLLTAQWCKLLKMQQAHNLEAVGSNPDSSTVQCMKFEYIVIDITLWLAEIW